MGNCRKPVYKCTSEGLIMHVAACYHGTTDQSLRNSGNAFRLTNSLTLLNFVALRQKVCEIPLWKMLLPGKICQSSP